MRLTIVAGTRGLFMMLSAVVLALLLCGVVGCTSDADESARTASKLADAKKDYDAGNFAEAERALTDLVRASPESTPALQALALAQAAQGKNAEAIKQYLKLVEKDSKDHASWYRMAVLERIAGMPRESAKHLEMARSLNPDNLSYTDELARTKMSLGEFREAATLWGSLLEARGLTDEGKQEILIVQAQAYQAAKDYAGAKEALQAALKLDPNNETLRAKVESFR